MIIYILICVSYNGAAAAVGWGAGGALLRDYANSVLREPVRYDIICECVTFKMVQNSGKIILELLIRLHARDHCR